MPHGTVSVQCPAAPDPALKGLQQTLAFTTPQGLKVLEVNVPLDATTLVDVVPGTYAVTAVELTTSDQTVVASAHVSPGTVMVEPGETTAVEIKNYEVQKYGAIDVHIGIIPALEDEKCHAHVAEHPRLDIHWKTFADFWSPQGRTTLLRRFPLRPLPFPSTVDCSIKDINLNNSSYSFPTKSVDLSPKLDRVSFTQDDVETYPFEPASSTVLPIVVKTDLAAIDANISVRVASATHPHTLIYRQTVKAQAGTTPFPVEVLSERYTVQAQDFIHQGIIYIVDSPATLTVAEDGSTALVLKLHRGAN